MKNLNEIINKISTQEEYVSMMEELAEETANYRLLDKIHYLVNKKLDLESNFYARYENEPNSAVYCRECGAYMCHTIIERQEWCLSIGKVEYTIHFTKWEESDVDNICTFCEVYGEHPLKNIIELLGHNPNDFADHTNEWFLDMMDEITPWWDMEEDVVIDILYNDYHDNVIRAIQLINELEKKFGTDCIYLYYAIKFRNDFLDDCEDCGYEGGEE